jgi:hypothetical protein
MSAMLSAQEVSMPVQEFILPPLIRHKEQSSNLHTLVCEVCGTREEFNPQEPDERERARKEIQRHRCKGQ